MVFLDKKGRFLSQVQLAAIFAQSKNRGISERDLNKTKITTLNDEIREEQKKGEKDYKVAVGTAITKVFKVPPKAKQPPKVEKVAIIPNANLNATQRRQIQSGKELRTIDVIRKLSASNGISHVEARRILESSNVIPTGLPDDAVLKPEKPIEKSLLKEDQKQAEQAREALATKKKIDMEKAKQRLVEAVKNKEIREQLDRESIARKNALLSGRFQAGKKPDEVKRKISDAAIRKLIDDQKETKRKQKILIEMGELQDQRSDLLQKGLEQSSATPEQPLTTPGIVSGVVPLREQTVKERIRRRALDLEVISGLSPQLAMEQAKKDIVRQQLG